MAQTPILDGEVVSKFPGILIYVDCISAQDRCRSASCLNSFETNSVTTYAKGYRKSPLRACGSIAVCNKNPDHIPPAPMWSAASPEKVHETSCWGRSIPCVPFGGAMPQRTFAQRQMYGRESDLHAKPASVKNMACRYRIYFGLFLGVFINNMMIW